MTDPIPSYHDPRQVSGQRIRAVVIVLGLSALIAAGEAARRERGPDRDGVAVAAAAAMPPTVRTTPDSAPRTWIEMKNVNLRVAKDAVVGVRLLRGQVMPTEPGGSALLDSTNSFSIRITSGTVAIHSADLAVILNQFVFGYTGSPLKHLKVRSQHQLYVSYRMDAHTDTAAKKVHAKELEQKLQTALAELPEGCRTVFQLSRFEELKYSEIADVLGVSVKTVENQIGKALKLLRTKLIEFLTVVFLLLNLLNRYL